MGLIKTLPGKPLPAKYSVGDVVDVAAMGLDIPAELKKHAYAPGRQIFGPWTKWAREDDFSGSVPRMVNNMDDGYDGKFIPVAQSDWAKLNDPKFMNGAKAIIGENGVFLVSGSDIDPETGKIKSSRTQYVPIAIKETGGGKFALDPGFDSAGMGALNLRSQVMQKEDPLKKYGIETSVEHRARDKANESDFFGPIANFFTGGLYSGIKEGDWKPLTQNALNSATGGVSGLYHAADSKAQGFGEFVDVAMDPGRTTDTMVRNDGAMFGDVFGEDARGIVGNYVIPIAATLISGAATGGAAAPIGAAAGTYAGNKFAGGDNNSGFTKAAIAGGTSALAGGASSSLASGMTSAGVNSTVSNVAASAATNAAINAGVAAASGQDVGQAALTGAVGGGLSGLVGPVSDYAGEAMGGSGLANTVSHAATNAASNALSQFILTGEVNPAGVGVAGLTGGIQEAYNQYNAPPPNIDSEFSGNNGDIANNLEDPYADINAANQFTGLPNSQLLNGTLGNAGYGSNNTHDLSGDSLSLTGNNSGLVVDPAIDPSFDPTYNTNIGYHAGAQDTSLLADADGNPDVPKLDTSGDNVSLPAGGLPTMLPPSASGGDPPVAADTPKGAIYAAGNYTKTPTIRFRTPFDVLGRYSNLFAGGN